jgi:CTP:molybdopterin cytidylyltransferase MocA
MSSDQPKITSSDLAQLLDLAAFNPNKIIFPCIDSKPCSPTLFPACFRSELLSLSGDIGGRVVRDANMDDCLSYLPKNPFNFIDIDFIEDYNGL